MIEFDSHPDCKSCGLWESCTSPGLPTRVADFQEDDAEYRDWAILVIGQAPGYQEDRQQRSWVGPAGQLLHGMLQTADLDGLADIYLSNAVRCAPPDDDATQGQIHACCPHLQYDIDHLAIQYPEHLILLLCGAAATRSVLDCSLSDAIQRQGRWSSPHIPSKLKATLPKLDPLPCYSTWHPSYVRKQRASAIYETRDHLYLLRDHLLHPEKRRPTPQAPEYTIAEPPPSPLPKIISLDIETYGALKRFEQTVFHPRKSEIIDGISHNQLVQTVALAWHDPDGAERVTVFNYQRPDHHKTLYLWFGRTRNRWLLGQTIGFDLSYLRYTDPVLKMYLGKGAWGLEDVILWNFLHSENRPERALKPFAKLFALADYIPHDWDFEGPDDPRLLSYNALDAVVNLRARALLIDAIRRDYGARSRKLSDFCRQHCSDLLWVALHMTEAGVPCRIPPLESRHARANRAADLAAHRARDRHAIVFGTRYGKGTKKSIQALVDLAAEQCGLVSPHDPRLMLTDKTKEISSKAENVTLFLDELPADSEARAPLKLLSKFRDYDKLQSTYTGPLLHEPLKGIVETIKHLTMADGVVETTGITYPTWYVCPSKYDYIDEDRQRSKTKSGGTIQGRITCKKFQWQTSPEYIERTICSRYPGGTLLIADLSQIELRVAALLSGDPVMLKEYEDNVDRHALTGSLVYGILFPSEGPGGFWQRDKNDPIRKLLRFAGKTTNFEIIYGGQAKKLHETFRADIGHKIVALGLVMPTVRDCQGIIDAHDSRYIVLRTWQKELVESAIRLGHTELISGWSRIFIGGRRVIEGRDKAKVLDHPPQTIAAQFLQGSQAIILDRIAGTRIVMPLQIYDSVYLDCPPGPSVAQARRILAETLPCPPLLAILEAELGRTVPVTYEVKERRHAAVPQGSPNPR